MRRIDASGSGERISALEGMSVAEKALTEEKARGPPEGTRARGFSGAARRNPGRGRWGMSREPEREKALEQERTAELDKSRRSPRIEMER